MHSAGFKLRKARLRIGLTYRDVEHASGVIAGAKLNPEFSISISRLAEVENRGALPTIYRIYSLSVIYRLTYTEILGWYGLDLSEMMADQEKFQPERVCRKTHLLGVSTDDGQQVTIPVRLDPGLNLRNTSYLTRMIEAWGKVPLTMLDRLNLQDYRYGYVGLEDWMMYPLIPPGSLLQIDVQRRGVESGAWRNEFERPVYFIEHHSGYACSWCSRVERSLVLQPHPLSPCAPQVFAYPQEAGIVGQVVGVAKQLSLARAAGRPPATTPR